MRTGCRRAARRWPLGLGLGLILWGAGCDDGAAVGPLDAGRALDAGGLDGAPADAGPRDDGVLDCACADQRVADGATPEAGVDLGAADGAALDGAPAPADQGAIDGTAGDAGGDAGAPDGAVADVGAPDGALDQGPPVELACFNGEDDDGDGRTDCEDPDCRPAVACIDHPEICDDGRDNNGDDWVDCDDPLCLATPGCPVPDVEAFDDASLQARFVVDCAGCHTDGADDGRLVLDGDLRGALVDVPSSQVAFVRVRPGKRAESYLYYKVGYRHLEAPGGGGGGMGMPPSAPWSAQDLERLGRWIDGLAPP